MIAKNQRPEGKGRRLSREKGEGLISRRPSMLGTIKSLVDIDQESLEKIKDNITNNSRLQLLNYIHDIGLPQDTIARLFYKQQSMIPEIRKGILEQFAKIARNTPLIEPNLTIARINPFTEFEKHPPLFFGIGGGSQMLCKGLPFDILSMILIGEKIRRLLNLGECWILAANRITYTNIPRNPDFSKESIDRMMIGERDLLQIVLEKFAIKNHWKVFLQTDLEEIIGSKLKVHYEQIIEDADAVDFVGGHHYSIEMADIWALAGQRLGGVKLSWFIRNLDKIHGGYIMDEQPFDARFNLYMALRNRPNRTSFAYVHAGARLFPGSTGMLEKESPYICYNPKTRLLLSPFENPVKKLADATKSGGGFNFKFIRNLFRNITLLFEEIVLGRDTQGRIKKIPVSRGERFKEQVLAEKTEYILHFLFDGVPEAREIWRKAFPKI